MKILHVDASILGDSSVSRQLSAAVVARLRQGHPDAAVTYYDLGAEPIGHLTGAHLAGFYGPDKPTAFLDHQETYLRGIFGFFGITDVTFVRAEGLNVSADHRKTSIAAATAEVAQLAA